MLNPENWQPALGSAWLQWEAVVWRSGWHAVVVAVGYGVAAALCAMVAAEDRRDGVRGNGWAIAAALLAALGTVALLHLDVLLLVTMRVVAGAQGWYQHRREWQYVLLVLLAGGGLAVLSWIRLRLLARWSECAPVVLGVAFLAALAALKGVSFHYTDRFIHASFLGASLGRLAELAGIGVIMAGALRRLKLA